MIQTQLNIASVQGTEIEVQAKIMNMIRSKRLEKLFKDFSLRATVIQCEPYDAAKKGKYRAIGEFLMFWDS